MEAPEGTEHCIESTYRPRDAEAFREVEPGRWQFVHIEVEFTA
jgi:hypothetical protein